MEAVRKYLGEPYSNFCNWCRSHELQIHEECVCGLLLYTEWKFLGKLGEPKFAEAISTITQFTETHCAHQKKSKKGNGVYQGPFAFTITKSPKDGKSVGDMLTAVRKVMTQKTCPVTKYAWYYEDKGRDENGEPLHPHIHGMYETATLGRIPKRQFERAWDIWDESKPIGAGFRGGYHRPVRSEEGYNTYIRKDGGMGESLGVQETE